MDLNISRLEVWLGNWKRFESLQNLDVKNQGCLGSWCKWVCTWNVIVKIYKLKPKKLWIVLNGGKLGSKMRNNFEIKKNLCANLKSGLFNEQGEKPSFIFQTSNRFAHNTPRKLRPTLEEDRGSNFLGPNLDWFEANQILELDHTWVPSLIHGSPN
jgi:hypothetical protein